MTTIQELAERRAATAKHYQNLGMMNAYGRTPEEDLKADAAHRLAFDAMMRAEMDYREAVAKLSTEELAALANVPSAQAR